METQRLESYGYWVYRTASWDGTGDSTSFLIGFSQSFAETIDFLIGWLNDWLPSELDTMTIVEGY